ncbi:hypothetical protein, partial [Streptomyces rochei]|uniref:hypothetical protein n=1 Tax=Streptomyces rochei TaxID=1928 RepID=UPI00378779FD
MLHQQQRSEIMQLVSQIVNRFLTSPLTAQARHPPPANACSRASLTARIARRRTSTSLQLRYLAPPSPTARKGVILGPFAKRGKRTFDRKWSRPPQWSAAAIKVLLSRIARNTPATHA